MKKNTRAKGRAGEDLAAEYLTGRGYRIIRRNLVTPFGELDIVAEHQNRLIFIEVKASFNRDWEDPVYNVTPNKLRRVYNSGQWYVNRYKWKQDYRFDVISIRPAKDGADAGNVNLEHTEGI